MSDPEIKLYTIEDATASVAPVTMADVTTVIGEKLRNLDQSVVVKSNEMRSTNFKTGSSGWQLTALGNLEANNGNFRGDITGATGTFSGTVTVGSLNIPDLVTANSFHVNTTGDAWWGATTLGSALASVLKTGVATFTNVSLSGSVAISGIANNTSTDISLLEKTHNIVFSVTDADTIAWTSGTITLSNGRTFSISSGNTGNMAALTYIYLDPAASTTVLQTTTTAATGMGANKVLLGVAQNNTVTASFIPYGPGQPLIDGTNIGALSIIAGNIAASTITGAKVLTMDLTSKTITADTGTIGGWTLSTTDLSKVAGGNTVAVSTGTNAFIAGTTGSPTITLTQAGAATFKSIQVGGANIQYTLNDNGVYNYGDGSDGAATFANQGTAPAQTTKIDNTNGATVFRLDHDVYYTTMTVNATVKVLMNGYRAFCSTSATINGTLDRTGTAGTVGDTAVGGTGANGGAGGAALSPGYLIGSVVGSNGGRGGNGSSQNGSPAPDGTLTIHSLASSDGVLGGVGGTGNGGTGGGAGTAGTTTASLVKLIANWHLATLLDVDTSGTTIKFTSAGASTGGGGGGGGTPAGSGGGGGGGAGSGGGILAVYAKALTIGAAGVIQAKGGNGGNGGDAVDGFGGVGGGGAGGNGGIIILVYNSLTNSGSITTTGGTKGTKGSGVGSQTNATDGTNGAVGVTYQFNLSL